MNYLSQVIEFNGQIQYEKAKLMEYFGDYYECLTLCCQSFSKGIKFFNIWLLFLKVYEKIVVQVNQDNLENYLCQCSQILPKEVLWRIYLEISQICERKKEFKLAKIYIGKSIVSAPDNMKWKGLAQAAKFEIVNNQNYVLADIVIKEMINTCNEKQKPYVLIEACKIYEYQNQLDKSFMIMSELKPQMEFEWKIYMEYISLFVRNKMFLQARDVLKESLQYHQFAGRLWSELIQIEHILSQDTVNYNQNRENQNINAYQTFQIALKEIPKSGEVWCEGARLCMNPYSEHYNLELAEKYLNFAIYFTPQYGDSFIELLKLYIIQGNYKKIRQLKRKTCNAQPNYGHLWYYLKQNYNDNANQVWKNAKKVVIKELTQQIGIYSQNQCLLLNQKDSKINSLKHITAIQQYNLLLTQIQNKNQTTLNNNITNEQRWKLIFQLDQSLNQQM